MFVIARNSYRVKIQTMARQLRDEYPGAVYHVMSCANRGEMIFDQLLVGYGGWREIGFVQTLLCSRLLSSGFLGLRLTCVRRGQTPSMLGGWGELL